MINLGSIFARSPFRPIHQHMEFVVESVKPLRSFFDAVNAKDDAKIKEYRDQVFRAEEKADAIKLEIRNHLPHSLFMPVDRRDFLMILEFTDSIANKSQDIVSILELRRMVLPEALHQEAINFIELNQKIVATGGQLFKEFENLVESGFGRHMGETMMGLIEEIDKLEDEADRQGVKLARHLFSVEDQMNPVDVVFWYQVFQDVGHLADNTEKVANRMRLIIAK